MTLSATAIDTPANPWVFVAWFGCLCGIYLFGQGLVLLRRRQQKRSIARIRDAKTGPIFVGGWRREQIPSAPLCPANPASTIAPPCGGSRTPQATTLGKLWPRDQAKSFVLNDVSKTKCRKMKTQTKTHQDASSSTARAQIDLLRDTYEEYGKTLLATFTDIPSGLDAFLKKNKVDTSAALRLRNTCFARS